jgi:hypothetical protein
VSENLPIPKKSRDQRVLHSPGTCGDRRTIEKQKDLLCLDMVQLYFTKRLSKRTKLDGLVVVDKALSPLVGDISFNRVD